VTVSPSEIVSVDGEKQNAGPPQLDEIVTAGSPAAPAPVAGASAIRLAARPINTAASPLRMRSRIRAQGALRSTRYGKAMVENLAEKASQAAVVGIACAQTIWRSSSTARHNVSTFASSDASDSSAGSGAPVDLDAATSWS
jgi:hypothetical protein